MSSRLSAGATTCINVVNSVIYPYPKVSVADIAAKGKNMGQGRCKECVGKYQANNDTAGLAPLLGRGVSGGIPGKKASFPDVVRRGAGAPPLGERGGGGCAVPEHPLWGGGWWT